jgi:hypothetical protein
VPWVLLDVLLNSHGTQIVPWLLNKAVASSVGVRLREIFGCHVEEGVTLMSEEKIREFGQVKAKILDIRSFL